MAAILSSAINGIKKGFGKLAAGFKWLLRGLFGEMQWTLPPWLQWSGTRLANVGAAAKRKPKTAVASLIGLIAVIAGGLFGYNWYIHLPKPVYPQCELAAPALTTYPDDKQKIHPLVVRCNESVAPLEAVGKPVSKGIELKPKVAGQWVWENDRKLVFTPAADWPISQDFKLNLAKQNLLATQVHLEKYDYEFKTAPFAAQITENQFY